MEKITSLKLTLFGKIENFRASALFFDTVGFGSLADWKLVWFGRFVNISASRGREAT